MRPGMKRRPFAYIMPWLIVIGLLVLLALAVGPNDIPLY
jgi:hypothetical protein